MRKSVWKPGQHTRPCDMCRSCAPFRNYRATFYEEPYDDGKVCTRHPPMGSSPKSLSSHRLMHSSEHRMSNCLVLAATETLRRLLPGSIPTRQLRPICEAHFPCPCQKITLSYDWPRQHRIICKLLRCSSARKEVDVHVQDTQYTYGFEPTWDNGCYSAGEYCDEDPDVEEPEVSSRL